LPDFAKSRDATSQNARLHFFCPVANRLKFNAFRGVGLKHELRHCADLEDAKGRIIMTPDLETLTVEQAQAVVATTEQPTAAVEPAAEPAAPTPAETNEPVPA